MDATIIRNWNAVVATTDVVWILGDFAWRNHNHYLMALNGKKKFVFGNHDKFNLEVQRNFTQVYGAPPGGIAGNTLDGQYMVLSHYPLRGWNGRAHRAWNLYGHVHGRLNNRRWKHTLDVGVDCSYANYFPLSWESIKKLMVELPCVEGDQDCDPIEGEENETQL
jgi:calcineurin-like phosphoesterase family protein